MANTDKSAPEALDAGLRPVGPRLSRREAYEAATDLERPVLRVRSLLWAVRYMGCSELLEDTAGMALTETVDAALEALEKVSAIHGRLFHGLHPRLDGADDAAEGRSS